MPCGPCISDKRGETFVRTLLTTKPSKGRCGDKRWETSNCGTAGSPYGGILARQCHASVGWLWRPLITILLERLRPVSCRSIYFSKCSGPGLKDPSYVLLDLVWSIHMLRQLTGLSGSNRNIWQILMET